MEYVNDKELQSLADLFRNASDPTRLRILLILLKGEECVCAIAEQLDVSVSAVSHQLRLLRRRSVDKGSRQACSLPPG